MNNSPKKKPVKLPLKPRAPLAPRLFAIVALLIVLALALSVLMPGGVIR